MTLSTGAIVGIAVGVVIGLGLLVGIIVAVVKLNKSDTADQVANKKFCKDNASEGYAVCIGVQLDEKEKQEGVTEVDETEEE